MCVNSIFHLKTHMAWFKVAGAVKLNLKTAFEEQAVLLFGSQLDA